MATTKTVANSVDTFGSAAVFIGNAPNGSPEWHQLRAGGIGGSEVGTILGLNKWESAYTLWAKKTGQIQDSFTGNEATEWGTRLEPVIVDKFASEHPDLTVHRDVGTWHHPNADWQRANPDAIYQDGDRFGIVEVKTAQFEDDWNDGVPRHYEAQVQWYLHVFGYDHAYVIALFHGNRYREYEVKADPFFIDVALDVVSRFRINVVENTAPVFDGALSTYETVRKLHPDIDADGEVELGWLGVQYFAAVKDLEDAQATVNRLKSHVVDSMGSAKKGLIDGEWVLSRQAKGQGAPYLVVKRG